MSQKSFPSTPRPSRFARDLATVAVVTLAFQSIACAPRQTGVDQLPDVNYNVTSLKDANVPGLPANVDQVVLNHLAPPGSAPGCAIGVMQNNQLAGLEAYGYADLANQRAMTTDTPAPIGSVAKTFTALGVLRLQEMNLLDIDDSLSDHLSDLPLAWQNITLRQALAHQSGLAWNPTFHPNFNTTAELNQLYNQNPANPFIGIHPRLVYPAYLGTPIQAFPVGYDASYSNTGFLLLGAVIDKVVRDNAATIGADYASYESFIWRQVGLFDGNLSNGQQMITPGLYTAWRMNDIPKLAKGYVWNGANFVERNATNDPVMGMGPAGWEVPAGSWSMTIGDLTRMMVALKNNEIISLGTRTAMVTQHGTAPQGKTGLGIFVGNQSNQHAWYHAGEIAGYLAYYAIWPAQNLGVAVMCNSNSIDIYGIGQDVADEYLYGGDGGIFPGGVAPGLGAAVGQGNEPVIGATTAQRLLVGLSALESHQQQVEAEQDDRLVELDTLGCLDLAVDTIDLHGYSITDSYLGCFDTSSNPASLESCVLSTTDSLIRKGYLTSSQRPQIESCLDVFTATP